MAEKVSVAEVKAKLSALLGEVAYGGKRFIIQRHGRPLAALVNVKDLERLEESQEESNQLHWALALVGGLERGRGLGNRLSGLRYICQSRKRYRSPAPGGA